MAPPTAARAARNESLRNVISQNASRLTDIVRLAPHVQEGKVVGFRVNPGRDRADVRSARLACRATSSPTSTASFSTTRAKACRYSRRSAKRRKANVTVLREGTPQALVIDTTQLQSLQEKRE